MKKNYLIFLLLAHLAYGQDEIVPKQQLDFQSSFIEAKKYAVIGRLDKAEESLIKLYNQDKTNAVLSFELAKVYQALKNDEQALKYASLAAAKEPENAHYQDFFGTLNIENEKYGDAIDAYEKLYRSSYKSEEYGDKLGTAYMLSGQYDQAIEVYTDMENSFGQKDIIIKRKIDIYQLKNDTQSIERELKKLVEYDPTDLTYLHNLASFYNNQNKPDESRKIYARILELDENDPTANMAIVIDPKQSATDQQYLKSLMPILEDENIPIDKKVLELIPFIDEYSQQKDPELGVSLEMVTEKLKNVHSDEAKAYAIYGDVLSLNNKRAEAIKMYQKTLTLDNTIYAVWEQLMFALAEEKSYTELEKVSADAIDFFPNQPHSYLMHGLALKESNHIDKAIEFLDEGALVASGDDIAQSKILTALAEAYFSKEAFKEAYINAEKAVNLSNGKNRQAVKLKDEANKQMFMRNIK